MRGAVAPNLSHVSAKVGTVQRSCQSPSQPPGRFLKAQSSSFLRQILEFGRQILWDFVKNGKSPNKSLKMRLTHYGRASQDQCFDGLKFVPYDRPEIARVLLLPKSPLLRFQSDESSAYHTARTTVLRSVVFAWPDCHSRAMVLGDELAIRGNPCSCAPDGQGSMVAPVQ